MTRYAGFNSMLGKSEKNPINENPLGLLIVLNKNGRRRRPNQSMGSNSNDNENEFSAFSYPDSDSDDDDYLNNDHREYLSVLNDDFALALSLDTKNVHFEPCRKMKAPADGRRRSRVSESSENRKPFLFGKRNTGKKSTRNREREKDKNQPRNEKEQSPRKISAPEDARPTPTAVTAATKHFWSPSSSWSAIGRFFGKFKHGHHHHDHSEPENSRNSSRKESYRRLSLQPPKCTSDPESDDPDRESTTPMSVSFQNSSYTNPSAFLERVHNNLMSGEMGQSGDVSHFKVVSKNANDSQFIVTSDGGESLAICKEYFSRLSCYDAMPNSGEVIAIDTKTPIEEIFNILRRHHVLAGVAWDSSSDSSSTTTSSRKLFHLEFLVRLFWPYFADTEKNIHEYLRRPVSEFFSPSSSSLSSSTSETCGIDVIRGGVSAEIGLTDVAELLRNRHDDPAENYGDRSIVPLVNDATNDVIGILSAKDILRFLSKELSKFDLIAGFDRTSISDIKRFSGRHEQKSIRSNFTLREAVSTLLECENRAFAVFDGSKPNEYISMLSLVDVVEIVAKSDYCNEIILSKKLEELFTIGDLKKDVPTVTLDTPVSKILKHLASSNVDNGNWDSILPIAVIQAENGDFIDFLDPEDLLTLILSSQHEPTKKVSGAVSVDSHERHDSGVGIDELQLSEETLFDPSA